MFHYLSYQKVKETYNFFVFSLFNHLIFGYYLYVITVKYPHVTSYYLAICYDAHIGRCF